MSRNQQMSKRSYNSNVPRTGSLNVKQTTTNTKQLDEKQEKSKTLLARNDTNVGLLKGRTPQAARSGNHPLPKKKTNTIQVSVPRQIKPLVANPRKLNQVNSESLNGRIVAPARVGNDLKDVIQSRLKKKSPWYDSIMSPVTGGGVKIPDPVGTNTGTFQHIQNVSVSVNANGVAGCRVVSPYINAFNAASTTDGYNYETTVTASAVTNMAWGGASSAHSFAATPALVKANAQLHRVVSACIVAQPETSSLSDAGEMCAFVTPFSCHPANVSYPDLQRWWDSTMLPINTHKPLIARWYPLEGETAAYNGSVLVAPLENVSYRDFLNPNDNGTDSAGTGCLPWEFGVVCVGMTANTGVVRFQIIVNYEFIPLTSQAMVTANPSPIDPMEEQLVNQWVSDAPVTEIISQKTASMAPTESAIKESSDPSGFGMFFNVMQELLPVAGKAAAMFL
jgi:hypothetical protein